MYTEKLGSLKWSQPNCGCNWNLRVFIIVSPGEGLPSVGSVGELSLAVNMREEEAAAAIFHIHLSQRLCYLLSLTYEGFATPIWLRHWGPGHGCTCVNSTHSLTVPSRGSRRKNV